MTRLTKDVRERMVTELLKRKFDAPGNVLAARSVELFTLVYEDKYDAETRRLMAAIIKRKRLAFEHHSMMQTNVGGMSIDLGNVRLGWATIRPEIEITPRPFLQDRGRNHTAYTDCPIAEKIRAFATDSASFTKEIERAWIEAIGALSTVTTAKQLSEMWPEAMPIIGKFIPMQSGSNVPAVQFAKLTQSFGLDAVAAGEGA